MRHDLFRNAMGALAGASLGIGSSFIGLRHDAKWIALFYALALLFAAVWTFLTFRIKRRRDLGGRAKRFSRDLYVFLGERRSDDPIFNLLNAGDRHAHATVHHGTATIARYNERYAARALGLFDELVEAGVQVGNRRTVESPTNHLGMEEVAQMIGAAGYRLNPDD